MQESLDHINKNIIGLLFQNGTIADVCSKVTGGAALTEDLTQEITLELLQEKKRKKVDELNEKGMLLAYIYGMARNQWNSKTSPFYRKYKKYNDLKKESDETEFKKKTF